MKGASAPQKLKERVDFEKYFKTILQNFYL